MGRSTSRQTSWRASATMPRTADGAETSGKQTNGVCRTAFLGRAATTTDKSVSLWGLRPPSATAPVTSMAYVDPGHGAPGHPLRYPGWQGVMSRCELSPSTLIRYRRHCRQSPALIDLRRTGGRREGRSRRVTDRERDSIEDSCRVSDSFRKSGHPGRTLINPRPGIDLLHGLP